MIGWAVAWKCFIAPSLVDAVAIEGTEVLLLLAGQLRALIIAEADLGERLVRAPILRRVALIDAGASGPVLIGRPGSVARPGICSRRSGK